MDEPAGRRSVGVPRADVSSVVADLVGQPGLDGAQHAGRQSVRVGVAAERLVEARAPSAVEVVGDPSAGEAGRLEVRVGDAASGGGDVGLMVAQSVAHALEHQQFGREGRERLERTGEVAGLHVRKETEPERAVECPDRGLAHLCVSLRPLHLFEEGQPDQHAPRAGEKGSSLHGGHRSSSVASAGSVPTVRKTGLSAICTSRSR